MKSMEMIESSVRSLNDIPRALPDFEVYFKPGNNLLSNKWLECMAKQEGSIKTRMKTSFRAHQSTTKIHRLSVSKDFANSLRFSFHLFKYQQKGIKCDINLRHNFLWEVLHKPTRDLIISTRYPYPCLAWRDSSF